MIRLHRILSGIIAVLVGVQAASHAWSSAGVGKYVQDGGVVDAAMMNSREAPPFPEALGFPIHGITGMMIIPAVAVILLIVSLLSRNAWRMKMGILILVLTAVQVALGMLGHGMTSLAFLHGLNALALFGAALIATRSSEGAGSPLTHRQVERVPA